MNVRLYSLAAARSKSATGTSEATRSGTTATGSADALSIDSQGRERPEEDGTHGERVD